MKQTRHFSSAFAPILLHLMILSSASASGLRTVALSGQQAPGTPSGTVFSAVAAAAPVINDAGKVAFVGNLQIGSGDVIAIGQEGNYRGVWSEGDGSLSLVARGGFHAPGTPDDAVFSSTFGVGYRTRVILNNSGKVSFDATLRVSSGGVTTSNRNGIWSGDGNGQVLVAREWDAAPDTPPGANYSMLGSSLVLPRQHTFNDAGQTLFYGRLRNDDEGQGGITNSNRNGLWLIGENAGSLVVRQGEQAPGRSPDVVFSNFQSFVLNAAGKTAFRANVVGGEIGGGADHGIWSDAGGQMSLIARIATQAPGMPTGIHFQFLDHPVMNNSGKVAFNATLSAAIDGFGANGVWAGNNDALSLVAVAGMEAPGAAEGIKFQHLASSSVLINQKGHTAFTAWLRGPSGEVPTSIGDYGIWTERNGELNLVARRGWRLDDPAVPEDVLRGTEVPGASPDTRFEFFHSFALNAAGQVAFLARTLRPGFQELGIWAQDRGGVLRLIAREGDLLDVDDGAGVDLRTIDHISFQGGSGGADGRGTGFNDRGQIAFYARFTDGTSGVFVSNVVAIPEPGSLVTATITMLCLVLAARTKSTDRVGLASSKPR